MSQTAACALFVVAVGGFHFRFDEAVVTILAAEQQGEAMGLLIVEEDEGTITDFEIHHGFVSIERTDFVLLLVHIGRLDVLFFGVQHFLMEDLILDVADGDFSARAMVRRRFSPPLRVMARLSAT